MFVSLSKPMLLNHAPPRKVIKHYRFPSSRSLAYCPALTFSAMEETSAPEHGIGGWYSVPDLRLRDHRFTVPLDYSSGDNSSPKISLFAREVVSAGKEEQFLPYLLYLEGGPGFECPRPTDSNGWIGKACEHFRVILMDQRGTGMSTPLTASSLLQFPSPSSMADYLQHFRADNIVNDAEFIRVRLVPDEGQWTILGQSYGGFCAVTYLSFAPHGLTQVLITGGIPPLGQGCTADSVYRACQEQVIRQNEKYYMRYPQDAALISEVVNFLEHSEGGGVLLPSGGILTARGLQTLGLAGLGSSTGFERMHYLFENVWDPVLVLGAEKQISHFFLQAVDNWLSIGTNPLYAILHESIYCQGESSKWSAHRIRSEENDLFDAEKAVKDGRPVFFTGETIFPWMFDEIHALKGLKEAANLLSERQDWSCLYNTDVLKHNKVPVAAAIYYEDMYVNFKLAMESASQIGCIRLWITNEYMHSGLRDNGAQVLDHLFSMLNGRKPLF